jgi:hypothetical protein
MAPHLCVKSACRRPDTLFITDRWVAPQKEMLLALLSDPISEDEAHVLREVLWERLSIKVLFAWLAEKPVSWKEFQEATAAI